MSKYTDEELFHTLGETDRLLQGVKALEGEEYSLEAILAEFGQSAAEPMTLAESIPKQMTEELPAVEEFQKKETEKQPESASAAPAQEMPAAKVETEAVTPVKGAPVPEMINTADLRKTIAQAVDEVMVAQSAQSAEDTKNLKRSRGVFHFLHRKNAPVTVEEVPAPKAEIETVTVDLAKQDAAEEPVEEVPAVEAEEPVEEVPAVETEEPIEEVFAVEAEEPIEEVPAVEVEEPVEEVRAVEAEEPVEEVRAVEAEEPVEEVPAVEVEKPNEAESTEESAEPELDEPEGYPGEPEGNGKAISLEQVMAQTVDAVLEEDDAILEPRPSLKERLTGLSAALASKVSGSGKKKPKRQEATREPDPIELEPEPDMEQAARDNKRLCKKWHKSLLYMTVPTGLLVVLSALDALGVMPGAWKNTTLLRFGMMGVLLLVTMIFAAPVWNSVSEDLQKHRIGCELAGCISAVVALANCLVGALSGSGENLPFAAPAAVMLCLCLYGKLQVANSRREAFHLADLGGRPPYGVAVTAAGACKQSGRLDGFYHLSNRDDPARRWQILLVPMLLIIATVLAFVVCLSDHKMNQFLWIWSALLTAGLPLSLPLTGTLSMCWLNRRLVKSGSAVAGYFGAQMVSRSKRMVLTDDDLFPPGTVSFNGLKIYGEEIGKVVSYAATVARASHSQLSPLFEQLLTSEGGFHKELTDLHYFEEGGVGGTIEGESVTMGSAYFMKKNKVNLPRELKLKTGIFLAVDGQLIAIFAIKYQSSRNVEWALQAIRRSRIQPVLAVRSENITPGLLQRKFNLDVKPVYPDVSTRLALSDLSKETVERAGAVIYREGLMPFAETVIGSRRLVQAVRISTVLCYIGAVAGLFLSYYLTHVGSYDSLAPLRMLAFLLLWLVPTLLLSGTVKHF
ncbi:MAG: hypothetical protein KBS74_02050 [Clostridiales bacterium]|nr:hypothetical protein [Candidatus Cacconaster stercorequi]